MLYYYGVDIVKLKPLHTDGLLEKALTPRCWTCQLLTDEYLPLSASSPPPPPEGPYFHRVPDSFENGSWLIRIVVHVGSAGPVLVN
jgi:hypothetical protein